MGLFSKNKKKQQQVDERPEVDDIESWLAGDDDTSTADEMTIDRAEGMVDVGASLAAFAPPPPAPSDAISTLPAAPDAFGADQGVSPESTEADLWHFPDLDDEPAPPVDETSGFDGLPRLDETAQPNGTAAMDETTELDNPWLDGLSEPTSLDPEPAHDQRAPIAAFDPDTVEMEDAQSFDPFAPPGETADPSSFDPPSFDAPAFDAPSLDESAFDAPSFDQTEVDADLSFETPTPEAAPAADDAVGHRDALTGDLIVPDIEDAAVLLDILGLQPGVRWIDVRDARNTLIVGHDPSLENDEDRAALARAIRREMNTAYAALRLLFVD